MQKKIQKKDLTKYKIADDFLKLLQKVKKRLSEEELDPFLKRFAGIVNSGKNEDTRSIYNFDE